MAMDVDLPKNRQGRYYHLNCGPGDLAPYILTCGDPDRARRIARAFDRVAVRRRNREFLTYTGSYHGLPVSVMATGIGAAASAIAVVEAAQCVAPATFIRLGSTGALQDYLNLGDLVITAEARREENTTHYYAPAAIKAAAHPEVLAALKQAAADLARAPSRRGHLHHPGFLRRPGASGAGLSHPGAGQSGASRPGRGLESGDGDVRLSHPGGGVDPQAAGRRAPAWW